MASGNSAEKALELLPSLKEALAGDEPPFKDYNLLKYLRWKQNVKRAADRIKGLRKWRKENPWAFDSPKLLASQDEHLKQVLESEVIVAPTGMVDKEGHTVLVGRLRNNDMSDGRTPEQVIRMMMYTMDRVLEEENAQKNGIVLFHDMRGMTTKNMHPGIPKLVISAIIGHFPIRIKGIHILDAPLFFRGVFSVFSLMLPKKLRERIHFVSSMDDIYKVIDQDQMLEEHGGSRKHDAKEWVASHIQREQDGTMQSLGDCPLE